MIILVVLISVITICTFFFHIARVLLVSFDQHNNLPSISIVRLCLSIILPLIMSSFGYKRKSLSYSGTCVAFIVGFLVTVSSYSFMACMIMFFYSASKVTKWRRHLKKKLEHDYKEGGQRNWIQVVCNGGVATQLAVMHLIETAGSNCAEAPIDFSQYYLSSWLNVAFVASVACCCGDTFASEVGSVVGDSQPRLITRMRRVPRGTNGAISIAGLMASLFGGLLIGSTYFMSNFLLISDDTWSAAPMQWPIIVVATLAGLCGSLIDSILGAKFQFSGVDKETGIVVEFQGEGIEAISGIEFLNNDSVNLVSSLLTALITPHVAFYVWRHL